MEMFNILFSWKVVKCLYTIVNMHHTEHKFCAFYDILIILQLKNKKQAI